MLAIAAALFVATLVVIPVAIRMWQDGTLGSK